LKAENLFLTAPGLSFCDPQSHAFAEMAGGIWKDETQKYPYF